MNIEYLWRGDVAVLAPYCIPYSMCPYGYDTTTLGIRYVNTHKRRTNYKNKLAQEAGAFEAQDPDPFQILDSF